MALVRVERLHYSYPPFDPADLAPVDTWALEDISLEVDRGEFLGILGTTGSGKTTFCLALAGLVPQQTSGTIRGDVWIGEMNTKRHAVVQVATHVGIVFQEPEANFLGLNVEDEVAFGLENLAYSRSDIEERLQWALELVGAAGLRQRAVGQLSGGQKQRVAIASAVAMLPAVLVLDDPTAELDPEGTAEVLDVIAAVRDRRPETAIIMTNGDARPIVDGADQLLVLDRGQCKFMGTPSDFIGRAGELLELGVPVPPLSELAYELNRSAGTDFRFEHVADAEISIRRSLAR